MISSNLPLIGAVELGSEHLMLSVFPVIRTILLILEPWAKVQDGAKLIVGSFTETKGSASFTPWEADGSCHQKLAA